MGVGAALIASAVISATAGLVTSWFGNRSAEKNFETGIQQQDKEFQFTKATYIQTEEQKNVFRRMAANQAVDLDAGTVEKGAPKRARLKLPQEEAWENPNLYNTNRSWIGDNARASTRVTPSDAFSTSGSRTGSYAQLLSSPGSLPPEATPEVTPEVTAQQFFQPDPPRDYGLAVPAMAQATQPLAGPDWSVAPISPQLSGNYYDPLDPSYSWRL